MPNPMRTHTCGELNAAHCGQNVVLSGWVHHFRNHGGLIFVDLRDRYGLTQLLFDPSSPLFEEASRLRHEWVLSIKGSVLRRRQGMENPKLTTGEIEVQVQEMTVLSRAETPPLSVLEHAGAHEEFRLKYRYLDIRRGEIAKNLALRHRVMHTTRNWLSDRGFLEIQTPILAKSTPEGARDYLVPSRSFPGNFYALPQSPQIFKQLLMVAGMDRYFQIAPCFRDEDLRADRQPEFMQIDIEMSFGNQELFLPLIEQMMVAIFSECAEVVIQTPFPVMTHKECIERYGTDRPDVRFGMPLIRLDAVAAKSQFQVFLDALKNKGCIKGLSVPGGENISRKGIEAYIDFVGAFGLKGLAWIKRQSAGISSNVAKFFSEEVMQELLAKANVGVGDLLLLAAGPEMHVNQALDHLRRKIAKERELIDPKALNFLWVTDFPLLRWNEEENRLEAEHHPFTSPHPDDIPLLDSDPLKVRALAYDIVLNGYELGGGSQRIHDSALQKKIFTLLNLGPQEMKEFAFFLEALHYGTPPHLGIAMGLDRLIMILAGTDNIRDVIAFPKMQKGNDLMLQCPSPVRPEHLNELKIKTEPVA